MPPKKIWFQWGREFRALCDVTDLKAQTVRPTAFQWGREFRALCDPVYAQNQLCTYEVFQWGREFRALCDMIIELSLATTIGYVSMGPRIPRAL